MGIYDYYGYDNHEIYIADVVRPYCYIYGFEWSWRLGYPLIYPTKDNDIPSLDGNGRPYNDAWGMFYGDSITIYEVRFCILIDGVQYGPLENYQECELGLVPLYPRITYFTIPSGYYYNIGFCYQGGQPKFYGALIQPMGFSYNFPERGDLDFDRGININDLTSLIDLLLGGDINNIDECGPADVDGDGNVTIADVTTLIDILL